MINDIYLILKTANSQIKSYYIIFEKVKLINHLKVEIIISKTNSKKIYDI